MKKTLAVLLVAVMLLGLTACGPSEEAKVLYLLNWGEYINEDVVAAFEEAYDCQVIPEEVDSNEAMYEKIKSGNTSYDVAVPSDYMVQKLAQEGLLHPLDMGALSNFTDDAIEPVVMSLMDEADIHQWAAPYFYGSIGIMFRNEFADAVLEHGFAVLFDSSLLPEGAKVGMYNSSRDAVAAALLHLGYSVNTVDADQLAEAEALLSNMDYHIWGDDNLKAEIVAGNLDVALVYSGDFFDEFYIVLEEEAEMDFDFMTPLVTNIWVDTMVIPTTTQNPELAHAFVNFFLDAENAAENCEYVGYTPVVAEVYQQMLADEDWDDVTGHPYFYDIYHEEGFAGQMYEHLSNEQYELLEEILLRSKQD